MAFDKEYIIKKRHSGRFSVKYHSWISEPSGLGDLTRINGNMNSVQYCNILDEQLPIINEGMGGNEFPWLLVQDNVSTHTSVYTRAHLLENFPDLAYVRIPPKSPDMNIIENVWAMLEHRVTRWKLEYGQPQNQQEYFETVDFIWNEMKGSDIVQTLVESIPGRVQAIIDAEGYWTKY